MEVLSPASSMVEASHQEDSSFPGSEYLENGKRRINENQDGKTDQMAKSSAAPFVLPPRKRLKTSASVTIAPSSPPSSGSPSPASPPSSPFFNVPQSPTRPQPAIKAEEKKEEQPHNEQKKPTGSVASPDHTKPADSKPQYTEPMMDPAADNRRNKKRKSVPRRSLDAASVFKPLPPRQAKVDSYKKSSKQETTANATTTTTATTGRDSAKNIKPRQPQKKRKIRHEEFSSSSDSEEEVLYCICKQPYDAAQFMIACDVCNDWFHGKCVDITERKAKTLATYICPSCIEQKRKEKMEKQKRRREEERERERRKEANKLAKAAEAESAKAPPRVCANEKCKALAKPNSKYCSTKCGILVAKQKILSEKQQKNNQNGSEDGGEKPEKREDASKDGEGSLLQSSTKAISVSESEDLKALKSLESQKSDTENNLSILRSKRSKLVQAIKFSTTLVAANDASKPKKNKASNGGSTMDIMDCFSCGQPIPGKNFARHIEQCYAKKEGNVYSSAHKNDDQVAADGSTLSYCNYYDSRSGSYCTRLADSCPFHNEKKRTIKRNQLCGCPTTDFESGYCERLRKECAKHVNWESIRTEELDQELIRLTQLLSSLQEEIEIVKSRIRRRNMTNDSQHRTIEEN